MPNVIVQLRNAIIEHFDLDEVRDLCFELDVQFDELAGDTLSEKARELVLFLDRRRDLPALIEACRRLRPKAGWPDAHGDNPAPRARPDEPPAPPIHEPALDAEAALELTRTPNMLLYATRKFGVFVDGSKVAELASGASARVPLRPGAHRLEVKVDWVKSRPLALTVAPGQTARVRVSYVADSLIGTIRLEWMT